MSDVDWSTGQFKIERSKTFWPWGYDSVNIFRNHKNGWKLVLADFSPRIMRWSKFPEILNKAAELTAIDGHARLVEEGKVSIKPSLLVREKAVKPKLVVRHKA